MLSSKKNKSLRKGGVRTNLRRLKEDFQNLKSSSEEFNREHGTFEKSKHYTISSVKEIKKGKMDNFKVVINGPTDTIFEGAKVTFNFKLKGSYPHSAPSVTAETLFYHPNIDTSGNICLDILQSNWSSAQSFETIAESLSSFLNDPNPDDPLRGEAAHVYKTNRSGYEKRVVDSLKKANAYPEKLNSKAEEALKSTEKVSECTDDYDSNEDDAESNYSDDDDN